MGSSSPQKSAGFYLREGDAFAEQGRWPQAQASFAMAMKLAPNASLTWLSYAFVLFPATSIRAGRLRHEWAEAVRWFEAALATGTPDSAPHLLLAISQLRLGKPEDALGHLVTAKNMEEAGAADVGSEGS